MKKYILTIILFFIFLPNINASVKLEVTLNKCVDGDTAWFNLNNEKIKTRFLAINTPESTNKIEKYGKKASEFTCSLLTEANKIQIEYDENSNKLDKYNRHLVWVFVDDKLLQSLILEEGLAEVKYIYGDYRYLNQVKKSEKIAKDKKLNIWNKETDDNNYLLLIISIIIILVIFNKKYRNKFKKVIKKKIKSSINK